MIVHWPGKLATKAACGAKYRARWYTISQAHKVKLEVVNCPACLAVDN